MALVPFGGGEIDRFRREMDRMFERFFGGAPAPVVRERLWEPEIDVSETENEIIVRGELPGIDPKNVDITLLGHTLTLKGEKRHETEEKGETYRFIERTYGGFTRTLELPVDVKPDQIEATYKDGVLKIKLPKAEKARTKKIPVSTV